MDVEGAVQLWLWALDVWVWIQEVIVRGFCWFNTQGFCCRCCQWLSFKYKYQTCKGCEWVMCHDESYYIHLVFLKCQWTWWWFITFLRMWKWTCTPSICRVDQLDMMMPKDARLYRIAALQNKKAKVITGLSSHLFLQRPTVETSGLVYKYLVFASRVQIFISWQ